MMEESNQSMLIDPQIYLQQYLAQGDVQNTSNTEEKTLSLKKTRGNHSESKIELREFYLACLPSEKGTPL